jgi:hypothetical protein
VAVDVDGADGSGADVDEPEVDDDGVGASADMGGASAPVVMPPVKSCQ